MDDLAHIFPFRRYVHLEAEPQRVSIRLGRYMAFWDVTRLLRKCIREYVDINHPFKIIAIFDDPDWPLDDGFRILGHLLAFLGNELLDFGLWQGLEIKFLDRELPFDQLKSPELPLEAFTRLRDLTWTGHPQQILHSWFPLTPSLLQNLEILTITCNISSSDCAYLLRHVDKLRVLSLEHIRRDSMSTSVIPLIERRSRRHHLVPALKSLSVTSDEDICLVLDQFYFPSLLNLTLDLTYTSFRSNFYNLESFDWGALERFELIGDFLQDVDETKLHTLLSSQAEFSPRHAVFWVGWATTPPTHA